MRSEEGLILLGHDGKVHWANLAAADLLGYTLDDFQKMALPLVHQDDNAKPTGPVAAAIETLVRGEATALEGDARFPKKDQQRVALHWKLWMLPPGQLEKRLLLAISEAAQATADGPVLSGYRDVFENAVEGIFRSTIEGQLIEANPALARMLGYCSPVELVTALRDVGKEVYVDPNRRFEFVRLLLEHGSVAGFEAEVYRLDGSSIWVAVFARTVMNANLEPLYFEGSVIDVTQRKQAEIALRRSEERFRRLAETTRFVPFQFDPWRRIFTYVGPQGAALIGPGFKDGLTLAGWLALVHHEDREQAMQFAREASGGNIPNFQTEFRVMARDQGCVWFRQIVSRDTANENADGVWGFFLDISEAKRLEEERERSRNQLRDLGARNLRVREEERMSVAREIHDELGQALTLLRIDLAWVMGQLGKATDGEVRRALEEKIGTMEQLIHWTLETVRRILAALRPPLLDEVGLKAAIEFHLADFSKRTAIRSELDATPTSEIPSNSATAVFRIFQEILTNIARHSGASRVKVRLGDVDGRLLLKVHDNGRGISQDKLVQSKGFGLLGMEERAWAVGGELEIVGSPRSGTTVTLTVAISPNAFEARFRDERLFSEAAS